LPSAHSAASHARAEFHIARERTGRRFLPGRLQAPERLPNSWIDGIPGNTQQIHYQLLRYGLLNWVTRGVYLGYWRNYFEVQVDDLFLADDAWDMTLHANNYDPLVASA
jgi:hypothetical protein